eukprot:3145956-Pyramimonas_sp.AAC.1
MAFDMRFAVSPSWSPQAPCFRRAHHGRSWRSVLTSMATWRRRTHSALLTTRSCLRIFRALSPCHASRVGRRAWTPWGWTLTWHLKS